MSRTLVYRIDVQDEINVQVGKFLKNIKRAGQNRRSGGKISLKNIKCAGRNKHAGGKFKGGNKKKISKAHPKYSQSTPKGTPETLPNHSQWKQ